MNDPYAPITWYRSPGLVPYEEADAFMRRRAAAIADRVQPELIWLLEHPPVYTRGSRARSEHVREPLTIPMFETDRGGEITYHGPGQRIAYVMIDVGRRMKGDVRTFVRTLETVVIDTLDNLGIPSWSDPARPGVWVHDPGAADAEAKIAAIGLKIRRGVSFHGLALNIAPDLGRFAAIVPCGLEGSCVTSLEALGANQGAESVDQLLIENFERQWGPLRPLETPPL
ncbi:MAG: lipoyl(octanoyl) transferase LipB [Hyphomicrobium sp.]|nr:lipoyl(octanoyl) transferase LipB [Hyphomicrobium sp.]